MTSSIKADGSVGDKRKCRVRTWSALITSVKEQSSLAVPWRPGKVPFKGCV